MGSQKVTLARPQIYMNNSTPTVRNSVIDGLAPGGLYDSAQNVQNLADDPLFVRLPDDGGDGWGVGDNDDFGDLHLTAGSPAIDSGHTAAPSVPIDLDGNPRFANDPDTPNTGFPLMGVTIDRGAYEFGSGAVTCSSDLNLDGNVDLIDYAIFENDFTGPAE